MFAASGVTGRLLDLGIVCPRWQFRGREEGVIAEFDLGLLADVTPYPYRLQCEQHKLVGILTDVLSEHAGFSVRYGATVEAVSQTQSGVTVATTDGSSFEGAYLIGADGGRSGGAQIPRHRFRGFHLSGALPGDHDHDGLRAARLRL